MNQFVRNALNSGAHDRTVKQADEQIPPDLEVLIDFIDPERINDMRFLAFLKEYKNPFMFPEEYVEYIESHYDKIDSHEKIDNPEDRIR